MLPWQRNTRQLKYQNIEVYLFILCLILGTRGSTVLEKLKMQHRYRKLCSATLNPSVKSKHSRVFIRVQLFVPALVQTAVSLYTLYSVNVFTTLI